MAKRTKTDPVSEMPSQQTTSGDDSTDGNHPTDGGFEISLAEVESIVQQLESGELTLGESLQAYERGIHHLRRCHEQLSHVQRKIELLVGFDESGQAVTESFAANGATLEEKQQARSRRRSVDNERVDDSTGLF